MATKFPNIRDIPDGLGYGLEGVLSDMKECLELMLSRRSVYLPVEDWEPVNVRYINEYTYQLDLDTPNEWRGQQNFDEVAITSSSNEVAWDLDLAQAAVHTLTENTEIHNPANMKAGSTGYITIIQAAGVYSLDWDTAFAWGAQSESAEPAANGDYVVVSYQCNGSVMRMGEFIRVEA